MKHIWPGLKLITPCDLYQAWNNIVEIFSQCHLSELRSKLISVSGAATALQNALPDKYIAGLWSQDIINGLLWYINATFDSNRSKAFRLYPYQAPSWSWASVEGCISYRPSDDLYRGLVKVLHVHTILPDPQLPTGSVAGGILIVRGYLIEILKLQYLSINAPFITGCFCPDD